MEKTSGGKKKRRRKKKGEKTASSKEEVEEKIQSPFKKLGPPLLCLEGVAHFCFPFLFFFVPLRDIKRWSGAHGSSLIFLRPESHWNYQGRGTEASSTRVFGIHAVRNFYCL